MISIFLRIKQKPSKVNWTKERMLIIKTQVKTF
jgi:ribosomal protein L24E